MASHNFIQRLQAMEKTMKLLPSKVAIEAVRFSKERFQQGNWIGSSTETWKPRKPIKQSKTRAGRGILTDSGRLRRSIRKVQANSQKVTLGTDVPYAQVHNSGGRYTASQNVGAHMRKAHKRNGKMVKAHQVNSFSRTLTVNMPRRQFIGESPFLAKQMIRIMGAEFNRILR
jgi:phage gpG-like protein